MIYTYQDACDALDAIVVGKATDEAYEVIDRFGYAELFFGCVYRKEGYMNISTAREIITQARKDEMYEGQVPEDDATCIKEAEDIVELAEQAWTQHIRGPEVETILRLASSGQSQNGDSKTEPEASSESEDDEEASAPPEDLSGVPENLKKMEPWEGYGEDRVSDITSGINYYLEDRPDDLHDLLTHIWAYESAHKRRARILKHLKTAFERIGVDGPTEEPTSESQEPGESVSDGTEQGGETSETGDAEAAVEELPADDEGVQQEAEGEESGSDEQESDAAADAITETPESGEEDRHGKDEAESGGKDQRARSDEDDGGITPYQKMISGVEDELRAERLDVPKPPEEKAPALPWRMNDISDADLRDMLMQFSSLAYYKSYIYSREERISLHCKEAADEMRNNLMVEVEKYDDHGKEKKVGLIEAEIESSDAVRKWRRLQRRHEQYALAAKREMESYHKLYESLSRLETMRHNSWERGRR